MGDSSSSSPGLAVWFRMEGQAAGASSPAAQNIHVYSRGSSLCGKRHSCYDRLGVLCVHDIVSPWLLSDAVDRGGGYLGIYASLGGPLSVLVYRFVDLYAL